VTGMSSIQRETADLTTLTQKERPGISASARRGSETRQRTILVALRLLPAEWETLQAAAQDRNISLSELLRSSALKAVDQVGG
jgi:hypothetical protein